MLSKLNCIVISSNKNKYVYTLIECVQKQTNHKKSVTTKKFVHFCQLCFVLPYHTMHWYLSLCSCLLLKFSQRIVHFMMLEELVLKTEALEVVNNTAPDDVKNDPSASMTHAGKHDTV